MFNAAIIDAEIEVDLPLLRSIQAHFSAYDIPYTIQTCTRDPHPIYADMLWREGYTAVIQDPLLRFDGMFENLRLNPRVTFQLAHTASDLELHYAIVAEGFELPPSIEGFVEVMLNMRESTHLIAFLDGEPAGAGTLVECANVAGIYNVATLPALRSQGVATAIMVELQRLALRHGYTGTALAASEMGLPLYERMGYAADGFQLVYAAMLEE